MRPIIRPISSRPHRTVRLRSAVPARLLSAGLQVYSMALGLRGESELPKTPFRVGTPERDRLGQVGEDPTGLTALRAQSRRELFFIDAAVVDPGAFWLAAPAGATVVRIPAGVDSWQFMAREAEQFRNLAAIHIVSHGEPGALILNGRRYAADDLEARSALLRELGRALAKNGDILLYGCDTGEGAEGARLVDDVAQITGADVAASSNPTGGLPGADWKLEIVHGKIGTEAVAPAGYRHVLANFSVSSISTLRAAIATAVSDGTDDTITLTANITAVTGDPVSAPDGNPTFVVIDNTGSHTLTVNGSGFTLSAANLGRVLYVEAGAVEVSNLTIANGLLAQNGANAGSGAPQLAVGAGIYNAGTLQLNSATVTADRATGGGGGGGVSGAYEGGGGGGSGGVGGIGGARGGSAGPGSGTYAGAAGSGSSGGRGGSYDGIDLDGLGGTSSGGGAGGSASFIYGRGGSGGTATVGGVTVGGGGGGSGYNATGGAGGPAAGGIFNSGTLIIFGSSAISNNLGAAGGGGGGGGSGNHGGLGGLGVGGIWNTGTLHIASAVYLGMSGNAGASGALGGLSNLGGSNSGFSSPTAVANIYNTGTLDTNYLAGPALIADGGSAAFTAADNGVSAPVAVDGGLTVSDPSVSTLASAAVAITGNFQTSQDVLSFVNNPSTMGNVAGSYDSGTGILNLTSSGASATLAQWQSALDSVAYTDTAVTPNAATRTVSFTVNDGAQNSATVTRTVTVADVDQTPIVTTSGGTTAFVSSGGAVVVDNAVTVSDLDNTSLASATIAITGNFHAGEDVLTFTPGGSMTANITGTYDPVTGILTLSSAGATALVGQWQVALRRVSYSDSAVTPVTSLRTISFVVNDGMQNSATATKAVSVTVTPVVTGVSGPANGTYAAGQNLDLSITFNEVVNVATGGGTPAIALTVGTNTRSAVYVSGSGTATLVFRYTVQEGDAAAGGISVASPITLDGGTILGAGSISAILGFTPPVTSSVLVSTAPVLTASGGSAAFTAGDNVASTPVVVDGGLTVADLSQATLASGTVSVTASFQTGEDVLGFTNDGSTMGNITGSYIAGTGILTLNSLGGTATLAQWQSAFRAVSYTDTAVTPNNATRTISFTVNDGVQNSAAATRTVTVADVDQTPVVTTSGGTTAFVSSGSAVVVDNAVTVSDLDNTSLASGTVAITANLHTAEDTLSFTGNPATMGNITGSYIAGTGVLTLTSLGNTATLAQWQTSLRAVTYADTAVTPNAATRTVSFVVNDGSQDSAAANKAVSVATTPVVTGASGPANGTYAAGQNLDLSITFNEVVTVATGGGTPVIAVTVGSNTRSAVYVSGSGTATLVFRYTVQAGDAAAGGISVASPITLDGGTILGAGSISAILGFTPPVTSSVLVSTAPVLTVSGGSAAFTAGDNVASTPVVVDGGLTVADLSQPTLASGTVSVTGNFQTGEDILGFINDGTTMGNITGSYSTGTGILTLSSSGATATLAQWQSALRAVTYTDTAVTPNSAMRTISFAVDDGVQESIAATRTVTVAGVDQTPVVASGGASTGFIFGGGAVVVAGSIAVTDRDNGTLASATVAITGNFQTGEDVLGFTNDGSTMGNIVGSYTAGTGVLALTSAGGTATVAQWQSALRAVTYDDTAATPNPAARTVSFTVNDGTQASVVVSQSVPIVQTVTPTIAWAAPVAITYGTALSSSQLDATASASGSAVAGTFSYNPPIGSILLVGSQTISVTFAPTDPIHYLPATASVTISVGQAGPAITWTTPAPIVYGTALSLAQLNAAATSSGASVAGSFVYNPATGTVLNAGSQTLGVAFTPSDSTDYAGATGSVNLNVAQASQTISFPTVVGAKVGVPVTLNATASSGLQPVSFALVSGNATLTGSTLTLNDSNPVVIGITQAGNANFLPAASSQTVVAGAKQSQTIALGPIPQHKTNDQPFLLSATSDSGLPVSFAILSGPATISGNMAILTGATGMVTVQGSQAGNATYQAAAPVTQSFAVVTANFLAFFGATSGTTGSSSDNGTRGAQAEAAASQLSAGIRITLEATGIGNNLAATLSADGTSGVLIGYLPSSNQGFVLMFSPDQNGNFSATATTFGGSGPPVALTISGTAAQGAMSGSIQPLGLTFSLTPDPVTGTSANVSGYYESSNLDNASGSTYMVVGTQGEVFVVTSSSTTVAAGGGAVNPANDSFSVAASSAVAVTGGLNLVSNTVSGTVTGQSGTASFSGTSGAINATHELIDMSGRGFAAPSLPLIVGFVIGGSVPKTVVLRGIGPGLAAYGIAQPLAGPLLALYSSSGQVLGTNAGWGGTAALTSAFSQLGAFALSPTSADSALETTLVPGAYSIVISDGANDGGGTALAEIYDASIDPSETTQLLLNISTRGQVTPASPVIGGFVVGGNSPKRVLIRAVGPALAAFGVTGALPDPVLTVYDGSGSILARNQGWITPQAVAAGQVVASASDLAAAANSVGAFPLAGGSQDSALIVTLAPGNYSADVTSAAGASGTALVEIYELSN